MDTPLPVAGKIGDDDQQARNRTHRHYIEWFIGDGATLEFVLSKTPANVSQLMVFVAGLLMRPNDRATVYDYALNGARVKFTVAPANLANIGCSEVAP